MSTKTLTSGKQIETSYASVRSAAGTKLSFAVKLTCNLWGRLCNVVRRGTKLFADLVIGNSTHRVRIRRAGGMTEIALAA